MSGLAALLAGRETPAVWRWAGNQPADEVRRAVASAGWAFGAVDGWTLTGRDQVLTAFGEALSFPEHYGRNLDALADCLADLTVDTVLLWDGWAVLLEEDLAGFLGVLAVLTDHSAASAERHSAEGHSAASAEGHSAEGTGRFAVLLRGAGPELPGVEEL
ncbi:barstar family protein [Nocardioides daejeonensis]|uniref:barstar family protein n=1 Tax=Nocardioides daejeonensis TaxID=1046556 RepID=UPI0023B7AD5D|nr:barstar family protein [Nocardioides daejeonensis]